MSPGPPLGAASRLLCGSMLLASSCTGREVFEEEVPGSDAGPQAETIRCREPAAGDIENFDLCFGYRGGEPPFLALGDGSLELDIEAVTVPEPAEAVPFVSCVTEESFPTIYFEADDITYSVAVRADRAVGPALPVFPSASGEALRVNLRTDGFVGSLAVRLDSETAHLAATRFGLVLPPVTEFDVERGAADGEPEESVCGSFQDDLLNVTIEGTQRVLARGDCEDFDGIAFLFVRAFHPMSASECTDQIAPISWIATWGDR